MQMTWRNRERPRWMGTSAIISIADRNNTEKQIKISRKHTRVSLTKPGVDREQKLCLEQSNTAVAANIDIFWLYPAVWWMKVIQFVCFMMSCCSSESHRWAGIHRSSAVAPGVVHQLKAHCIPHLRKANQALFNKIWKGALTPEKRFCAGNSKRWRNDGRLFREVVISNMSHPDREKGRSPPEHRVNIFK